MEMRIPNFNLHQYTKCILMNVDSMHPHFKLHTIHEPEEYAGTYCITNGSQLLLQEMKQHHNNEQQLLRITGKTDVKCVFHSRIC